MIRVRNDLTGSTVSIRFESGQWRATAQLALAIFHGRIADSEPSAERKAA